MSGKQVKSFSLDPKNTKVLEKHDNASALVNDLLEQFRKGSDKETVALDLQINQKEGELQEARDKVERLENEVKELKQLRAGIAKQSEAKLEDAKDALENVPREIGNPAIEEWSGKLGITQQELLDELNTD